MIKMTIFQMSISNNQQINYIKKMSYKILKNFIYNINKLRQKNNNVHFSQILKDRKYYKKTIFWKIKKNIKLKKIKKFKYCASNNNKQRNLNLRKNLISIRNLNNCYLIKKCNNLTL